jgi:hypothetical protein
LFYKSHARTPFKQSLFILTRDAQLVQFNDVERNKVTGQIIPSVYHARKRTHDLTGSYVYIDNHAAPLQRPSRMYEDGLVVPRDEETTSCTFSLWLPSKRKYFSPKQQKVIVTKQHILQGKSWMFTARTRTMDIGHSCRIRSLSTAMMHSPIPSLKNCIFFCCQ